MHALSGSMRSMVRPRYAWSSGRIANITEMHLHLAIMHCTIMYMYTATCTNEHSWQCWGMIDLPIFIGELDHAAHMSQCIYMYLTFDTEYKGAL